MENPVSICCPVLEMMEVVKAGMWMFKPVRMVWGLYNDWTYEWFYTSALGLVLIFTDSWPFENDVAK